MTRAGVASAFPDHSFDNDGNLTIGGTASAYTVKTARKISGNYAGLRICARVSATNTGAVTLQVDDATAASIITSSGTNPSAGELVDGGIYDFIYDADLAGWQFHGYSAALTAGQGIEILSGVVSTSIGRTFVSDITSGLTLTETHRAQSVAIGTGTGTITLSNNTVIRDGFWCIIKNNGTGAVTLQAAGGEDIDTLSSWVLYTDGAILLQKVNSTAWRSILLCPMTATFDASGTWVRPGAGNVGRNAYVSAWGAGGSGGRAGAADGGGGGGGGAFVDYTLSVAVLSASVSVTIGAGGASRTADNTDGAAGGNTTFGAYLTAYGGGGGAGAAAQNGGGGGGGQLGAGASSTTVAGANGGSPTDTRTLMGLGGATSATVGAMNVSGGGGGGGGGNAVVGSRAGASTYGGGGGGGGSEASGAAAVGGESVYGGGGGGGGSSTTAAAAGGTSLRGGAGGAGAFDANNATAGTAPGGGGGGSESGNSGAGAAGRLIIRVF